MTPQHKILFEHVHSAGQKFDYFVCGAAGAIFAFAIKNLDRGARSSGFDIIFVVGLLLVGFAFIAGLERIRRVVVMVRLNMEAVQAADRGKELEGRMEPVEEVDEQAFRLFASEKEKVILNKASEAAALYDQKVKAAWDTKH